MTTDPFTEAARAEAERRWPMDALPVRLLSAAERKDRRIGFEVGARWARDRFAQEPPEAEVEAAAVAICSGEGGCDPCFNWDDSVDGGCTYCTRHARAALSAARAARRDEENR